LKTEWNTAKINHNNNLSAFQKAFSNLINEKIYLNYLTNISLEKLLADSYTLSTMFWTTHRITPHLNQVLIFKILNKRTTAQSADSNEQTQYRPTLGVQGYIGANQYTQSINPFS
jgi:hypothetical protein